MAGAWWVWPLALGLYGAFRLWYDNWRGPLRPAEIEHFLALAGASRVGNTTDLAALRSFLEADDGREFVMSNLVRLHPGAVAHPHSGAPTTGQALLQAYARHFVRLLLRHGGHPVLAMRKVGGYVDAWNVAPDPGWHVVGAMRYRSRRDLMKIAVHPALGPVHRLKSAGTAMTFSFPAQPIVSGVLRPRAAVALLLALAAALVHLASVIALLPG